MSIVLGERQIIGEKMSESGETDVKERPKDREVGVRFDRSELPRIKLGDVEVRGPVGVG